MWAPLPGENEFATPVLGFQSEEERGRQRLISLKNMNATLAKYSNIFTFLTQIQA